MHVIGTAGHVDHGKSTLVRALTGIDPDRLAEEKRREMTIDLGFAWLTLGEEEVGVIDVPGHRDFIENMLAGVGGIDLALLVIAADEGVMPQTREHLAILDLLAVKRGVVALTKVDLIDDPEWLDMVTLEVTETLRGTALADVPIAPVSARTGAGLEELKKLLSLSLRKIEPPVNWGRPRLPIDRVFTLPGFGVVVTGTLLDGRLRAGDEIEIQPGGLAARIRGLQTHKTKRETALPGSRVAVNLVGPDRDQLGRGQVLAGRGQLRPTQLIDADYRHLRDADPLRHHDEVKLFVGSAEVSARARLIGGETVAPGEAGRLQLALAAPVAVARGDRFILRRPSPGATLGGGRVLDPHPGRRHRRFRPEVLARFDALVAGAPDDLLLQTLTRAGPLTPAVLFERAGVAPPRGEPALADLKARGEVIPLGKTIAAAATWRDWLERVPTELAAYHHTAPLRPGLPREELRARTRVPAAAFGPLLATLIADGYVAESGTLVRLAHHHITFTPDQTTAIDQLMALFAEHGVLSPSVKECKAVVGEDVYQALIDLGHVRPVSEEVVYDAETYARLIDRLTTHLRAHGAITPADARDLLGASRKYAIALLEHMDELHLTRRDGDVRTAARVGGTEAG
jgi:selenocysteine-specific elongation factor